MYMAHCSVACPSVYKSHVYPFASPVRLLNELVYAWKVQAGHLQAYEGFPGESVSMIG